MTGRERLEQYLDQQDIPYQVLEHPLSFTAQRTAEVEHISGRRVMKVVIVEAENRPVMVVVPATYQVDAEKVAAIIGVRQARVAREEEFAGMFEDCEIGAMSPFGNLYRMPVYVDASFVEVACVVFPAGTHTDCIALTYRDFARLVRPVVADLVQTSHSCASA